MFRSLHMKLVLIMMLLITSLMAVVGTFLMTNVSGFYIDAFYQQMNEAFGENSADFVNSLRSEAAQEDGVERLENMLSATSGTLGIDYNTRNFYILDGNTGAVLYGSDDAQIQTTANILTARNTREIGSASSISASYMDIAIPIIGGEHFYIIYILDNLQTVSNLNSQLFMIILQALVMGLLISVLLSFLLAKAMINPIEKLTDGAQRIADGNFDEKITAESTDEIGILTTTFNHMADVLQTTLSDVENERNKLDTLFLHMTDGVIAFDRSGHIIHRNPAASELLHVDEGSTYQEMFQETYPFELVLALQRPNFVESEISAGEKFLEVYLAPFSNEDTGGVIVVIHDVTTQRRNEEQRKEFVANVSHELRTPLTNVRSYAETLRDSGDIPEDMKNSFLDIIITETDRMTHIVQDLLVLSRLDSGRAEMAMARFDFSAAIDSVCRSVALDAKKHQHTLTCSYRDLPLITGDRGRLEQVMMNVVGNAIKYTPDGGKIAITAGVDGDTLWLEVADNGIGIPEKDRSRIFDRFYRVDKARSRESGGTGLGLSIAKEIVERHHGTLALAEHEGPGCTVRMTLPIAQKI
ncbi:MAG: HAMP domain-containing protein [Oscillospiraceae bacterium]|nr:HAMP domain-containing protein [Oscillospiraceae bacterium]